LPFAPGTRLGVYEITAQIGAGGMGEVYRATDTKLKRQVAIKVLPLALAADRTRLARFQREAEVLASLNHPNIAAIYGLEESPSTGSGQAGITALVMELVEGNDLSQRIARGAIPIDEALPIAKQIAEALEAAHEQGIIHRDLKPANIRVRVDGTVKVLDFGLAKSVAPAAASDAAAALANVPTITSTVAMTATAVILGTAAYMSPEQARGGMADTRSDMWALGVVLWEMLTATRLFSGATLSDTLAAVLRTEPAWNQLPADTPVPIRRLLRRCLEKDRSRRLDSAADARLDIEDALSAPATPDEVISPIPPDSRSVLGRALPWGVAGAAVAGLLLVLAVGASSRRSQPPAVSLRLSAELGASVSLASTNTTSGLALSPDGATLAFVAQKERGASEQLYLRPLNRAEATPLSGTDGVYDPFFSPDGQWIAFFAQRKLKKVAVSGGAVVTLCDAPSARGGWWGEDGTIVFSPDVRSVPNVPLQKVSSLGGKVEPLIALAPGEATQRQPQMLPGGRAVLFTSSGAVGAFDDADLVVVALDSGTRKIVQRGAYHGRYLSTGYLVYLHEGALFSVRFDLGRLEAIGQLVQVLQGLQTNAIPGSAELAVSDRGTLAYVPGADTGGSAPIHWMDRSGQATLLRGTPANWANLRFAPDGRRLAVDIVDGPEDIWVYEWELDTLTRVTSNAARDREPLWTPDSRRVTFASTRADASVPNLYWQLADGTGEAERLTQSPYLQTPGSWHPGGHVLAFTEQNPNTGLDLMLLPMTGDEALGLKPGSPTAFLSTPFTEAQPAFSPDGRWLAYSSDETGRLEVYVRPFPGPGGKWRISTGGGSHPTWSRAKHELLFSSNGRIMVSSFVADGDAFHGERPQPWSETRVEPRGASRMFDLHPDGARIALRPALPVQDVAKQDHVTLIFGIFDQLRRNAVEPLQ
jgi:serine/threonine protein kinase